MNEWLAAQAIADAINNPTGTVSCAVRMRPRYVTFDLWIWKTDNGFEANADSGAQGAGPVFFSAPLGVLDVQRFYGRIREPAGKSARLLGHRLFEFVFQGDVRERYYSCRRMAEDYRRILRVRLNLQDHELWKWPWECLYDEGFLALSPVISLVRRFPIVKPVSGPHFSLGSRAVIVFPGANQDEVRIIERAMRRKFDLTLLADPSLGELQAALAQPIKILHFLGRTAFRRGDGLTAHDLACLLERLRSPSLVVLNGLEVCSVSDLAPRVARAGASAVLAMHLPDELAGEFNQAFYDSLANGQSLERAVWLARQGLAMHNQEELGASPILCMQKDCKKGLFF